MTAFTATLTRWRIEWLVLQWRFKLRRDTDRLEMRRKRFRMHNARITELLTPQQFLEQATILRDLERNRAQQWQHLGMFVHLLRTQRPMDDLEQVEATLRQLLRVRK